MRKAMASFIIDKLGKKQKVQIGMIYRTMSVIRDVSTQYQNSSNIRSSVEINGWLKTGQFIPENG